MVYIPELEDYSDMRLVSLRRITKMKGENSGVAIALKQLINSSNWANAWISLVACGLGWFAVSKIDWKKN